MNITIISITYAIKLSSQIIDKIMKADKRGYKALRQKLKKRNEVKEVQYGESFGEDIKITILTDSVTNPKKNLGYWDGIADEIEKHLDW